MKPKLLLGSLVTLGLLSGMVFSIILAAAFLLGTFSWMWLIGLTIFFNSLLWLVSPYISDLVYRWFYSCTFYSHEELKDYPYMKFITKVCEKHHIKPPKIGIIKDQNPTAFTYGSAAFNARIMLTEGLFTYLNEEELEAVIAHELGHIVHRDFIIMTIAATLVSLLYQMYVIFTRSRHAVSLGKTGSQRKGGSGYLYIVGLVSYLFYIIGTYVLLFLSRVREYYADAFSAGETGDANLLSSALIKVAYGIAVVPDTAKTAHLLNSTRSLGIFDHRASTEVGLICLNGSKHKGLLEKALLFDIVNPWAWLQELSSTHPLVGKRIRALSQQSPRPAFDFERLMQHEVDRSRLWRNFLTDLAVSKMRLAAVLVGIVLFAVAAAMKNVPLVYGSIAGLALLVIVLTFAEVNYRYPVKTFRKSTTLELMADLYASPVRGTPVELEGQTVGRGVAGAIFSEDMMFQDRTGLVYLNYESGIPLLGNLLFAWKKMKDLIGKPAKATGWFMRGATHHIELYRYYAHEEIKGYVRFWFGFGKVVTALILMVVFGLIGSFLITLFQVI